MLEIGRAVYFLIAMAALSAAADAAGGEGARHGLRLATGLCEVACLMGVIDSLMGMAG